MANQQQEETHHQGHTIQTPLQATTQPIYQQLPNATASATPGGQPIFDLGKFWMEELHEAQTFNSDFKSHPLPLARIKKVMKTDEDVKMISAEAPILFAKGCEIFITELTKRAWVHAEENKRRTLQRSDIATAISKTDMCDFLIDIVPREEANKYSNANPIYEQNPTYNNNNTTYYQQQYPAAQMDAGSYYPQLPQFTNDQVQQYQMQLQQFAQQQTSNFEEEQAKSKD